MKNISLAINIVLLLAVGVLFYLQFSNSGSKPTQKKSSVTDSVDIKIAYVRTDSLLLNYTYVKDKNEVLQAKATRLDKDLRNRAEVLQNEISNYQKNVGGLTLSQAQAVEEDLNKKRERLQLLDRDASQQMMEDQASLQKDLYDRLTKFLDSYGKEKGLKAILKYDVSSDVLYIDNGLDITAEVVEGLNSEYEAEKSATGAESKTDSTGRKKK